MTEQHRSAGNAAFQRAAYQESLDHYAQALQDPGLDPSQRAILHSNRAAAWLKLNKHKEALQDATKSTHLDASNGKAWYRLALAHQALQHHQAAHVAAQHAAHLMPNNTVHSLVQQLELAMPHPPTHLPACPVTPALFPAPLTGTYVPDARGSNYNLLILLHGLGDTHVPFAQLARRMELPDTAAVALGGVEEVEETGGRAWFAVEWVDDDEGGSTIQVCVVPLGVHHDSHAAQGATAALHLAMQQSAKGMALGSCVAVCGTLLPSDCAPPSAKGVSMDTRRPTDVLLVHGRLDEATPPAEVDRAERVLLSSGMQVTRVALSRGAGMLRGQGEMRSVMEFWGRCMLAAPPPGAQDVTDNS